MKKLDENDMIKKTRKPKLVFEFPVESNKKFINQGDDRMELKERIMEATIDEFNEKNLKFTMDDIAKRLGISKKTIYTIFQDKETLFFETVDYCFTGIKESEAQILEDETLDIMEKLKRVLIVLPDRYKSIDWRQIYETQDKFPRMYHRIEERIENEWEGTIGLLEEAIRQGRIKPISIPIFKIMVESTIKSFLSSKNLIDNNIAYEDALKNMVDILMDGIEIK